MSTIIQFSMGRRGSADGKCIARLRQGVLLPKMRSLRAQDGPDPPTLVEEISSVEGNESSCSSSPLSSTSPLPVHPELISTGLQHMGGQREVATIQHNPSVQHHISPHHQILLCLILDYRLLKSRDFGSNELCAYVWKGSVSKYVFCYLSPAPQAGLGLSFVL